MATEAKELLAVSLSRTMGCANVEPDTAALIVAVVRLLAQGRPVERDAVFNVTERGDAGWEVLLELGAQVDNGGRIVAFGGLSLLATRHRFELRGRVLHTWCAVDTLLLPALVGETALVESPCEATGKIVRLKVGPEGIERAEPRGAVISLVSPAGYAARQSCGAASCGPSDAIDYKELVGASGAFCGNVHFFVSQEAAAGWLSSHTDGTILTLEEGYELGRKIWVDPLLRLSKRFNDTDVFGASAGHGSCEA
jgi:alkylmercury lyase